MKRFFLPSAIGAVAAMVTTMTLTGCGDSTYEYHQTNFYPLLSQGLTLYADETSNDSLSVVATDSWTATTTDSWLKVSPTEVTNTSSVALRTSITLTADVNNTGTNRYAAIEVSAYDNIAMPVHQVAWLNISLPEGRYDNSASDLADYTAQFLREVDYADTVTTIAFTSYAAEATLTSSASWMTLGDTAFADPGSHATTLAISTNPNYEERTDSVLLTSAGVITPIYIIQAARR